ncbi:hypothetical protein H1P_80003 [Hyella patelloides LEGE 07179]|uniref:Uncharacterized protein n=1 Tax=Hyella patelloides LEGE 07179 TaxID=945734 RepID=A0A563W434_9CYAN|nr:hypothetical protein [Hyella patelloides]VEP18448.1 hypothetical protein H1P_80003 [Hyella patelloides LEGE 07179]
MEASVPKGVRASVEIALLIAYGLWLTANLLFSKPIIQKAIAIIYRISATK